MLVTLQHLKMFSQEYKGCSLVTSLKLSLTTKLPAFFWMIKLSSATPFHHIRLPRLGLRDTSGMTNAAPLTP